jgi:hypothetical protein
MADEAIRSDGHQIADKCMRLHLGAFSDGDAFLYLHERPNEASRPDLAAIDVARLHYGDTFTELDILDADAKHPRTVVHGLPAAR